MAIFDKAVFTLKKNETEAVHPEIAAFESKLEELEQQKKDVIFDIGMNYVEKNTLESASGTEYVHFLRQLEEIEKEKVVLNKRILAVQGLRKCEKCENILPLDSAFCNKCGEKLQPLFAADEVAGNMCSKCGASLSPGAAFCTACGAKVEE